jgi:protease I
MKEKISRKEIEKMNRRLGRSLYVLIPVLILALTLSLATAEKAFAESGLIEGKKIAMIISYEDFQDTEFRVPKKMFDKEGALVTVVSSEVGNATGKNGASVKTELLIGNVNVADFDAVVFIGGRGVREEYWYNPEAHALAQEAVKQGKVVAAICWAPVILANAGVLDGKKGTVATVGGAGLILQKKGCKYDAWHSVVVDGRIITANSQGASKSFAKAIVKALEE